MILNLLKSRLFNIFFISYCVIILIISLMLYKHTNVVLVKLKKDNNQIINKLEFQKKPKIFDVSNKYLNFLYEEEIKNLELIRYSNQIFKVNSTKDKYNQTFIFKITFKNKVSDADKLKLNKFVEDSLDQLINDNFDKFIEYEYFKNFNSNKGNRRNVEIVSNLICDIYSYLCDDIKLFVETDDEIIRKEKLFILLTEQKLEKILIPKYIDALISYSFLKSEKVNIDNLNTEKLKIAYTIQDYSKINKIIFISFVIFLLIIPLLARQIFSS